MRRAQILIRLNNKTAIGLPYEKVSYQKGTLTVKLPTGEEEIFNEREIDKYFIGFTGVQGDD